MIFKPRFWIHESSKNCYVIFETLIIRDDLITQSSMKVRVTVAILRRSESANYTSHLPCYQPTPFFTVVRLLSNFFLKKNTSSRGLPNNKKNLCASAKFALNMYLPRHSAPLHHRRGNIPPSKRSCVRGGHE